MDLSTFLRCLYGLKRITSNRIAETLDIKKRTVVKYLEWLWINGVDIRIDFDLTPIGLKLCAVTVDAPVTKDVRKRLPEMRFASILPNKTIIVAFCTECDEGEEIIEVLRPRPDPSMLFEAIRGEWRPLVSRLPKLPAPIAPRPERVRYDWIDLEIISAAQYFPAITIRALVKKVKQKAEEEGRYVEMRHILHHLQHAESLIRGYRVSYIDSVVRRCLGLSIWMRASSSSARILAAHPLVRAVGVTARRLHVLAAAPKRLVPQFIETLRSLGEIESADIEVAFVPKPFDPRNLYEPKRRWIARKASEIIEIVAKI